MWRDFVNAGLDFLYPPACSLCQKPIIRTSLPDKLLMEPEVCKECISSIPEPIFNGCTICGAPSGPHIDTSKGCFYCTNNKYHFQGTYAFGVYRTQIKQICLKMKKKENELLTIWIADRLYHSAFQKINMWKPELIIPVTGRKLFPWSECNPAPEILAERLSQHLEIPCREDVVKKIRTTQKQVSLSPTLRKTNLNKAYQITNNKAIQGKRILLVDDTMTTGSTLNTIARELLRQNACEVYNVVFSRGLGLNID